MLRAQMHAVMCTSGETAFPAANQALRTPDLS